MKTIIITLLLTMAFIINSCSKDDENSLTAPTTDGSGTLSFLLDGKVWRPKTSFNFPTMIEATILKMVAIEYDTVSGNVVNDYFKLHLWAYNEDKNQNLIFDIDSVLYAGKYKIKEALWVGESAHFDDRFNIMSSSDYVEITKIHRDYKPAYTEKDNHFYWGYYTMDSYVSGKFSMTLKNKRGDSIVITNGRFDLKNAQIY